MSTNKQSGTNGKKEALNTAITQIERTFGKGSIMRLGEGMHLEIPSIPCGIISIDMITGVGGFPRGRVTEIYGREASGKTTLALHVIACAQQMGGVAAFIDAEHALNAQYAKALGVNIDELLISQPDYGEQALDIAEMLVRSGAVDIIVVDSVAALVPKAELDGDMGDSHMGLQARLMSQALRKLAAAINKSHTVIIFINQVRENLRVMFGSTETTTGGNALKFYSSLRVETRRISSIKDGRKNQPTATVGDKLSSGNRVKVTIVKNKISAPFRSCVVDVIYGEGISRTGDLLDLGVDHNIIDKSGTWFSFGDVRLGQGRENVKDFLSENSDILANIEKQLKIKLGLAEETEAAGDTAEESKKSKGRG